MSEIILGATIHPLAAMFPLLEGEEFEQLVESIDKHGIQTPILLLHHPPGHPSHKKGQPLVVVDGRNRLRAWERLANQGKVDREYWTNYVTPLSYDGDPNDEAYIRQRILAANIHRRHLTPDQRAAIMLRLTGEQISKQTAEAKAKTQPKKGSKVTQSAGQPKKRDKKSDHANSAAGQLAAAAKVGRHTAANAIAVAKAEEAGELPPGTMKAVEDGATTLAKAKKKAASKKPSGDLLKHDAILTNWRTYPVGSVERAKALGLEVRSRFKDLEAAFQLWHSTCEIVAKEKSWEVLGLKSQEDFIEAATGEPLKYIGR